MFKQKTIQQEIVINGQGLFTGKSVEIRLLPLPENSGLLFRRMDLAGQPVCRALLSHAVAGQNCTSLKKDFFHAQTIEHLLSAISVFGISNLMIEINGPELPIGDGSAKIFVDALEKVSVYEQNADASILKIKEPVFWSDGDISFTCLPSKEFKISYALHYPDVGFLQDQFCSFTINEKIYKEEIAPCRTFALFEHIKPLLDAGLLKGGGLHNGVVIKDNSVLNPEGVRFRDEPARHKILDLIGDLALTGMRLFGHIIAIRSGHASNIAFAKKLKELA